MSWSVRRRRLLMLLAVGLTSVACTFPSAANDPQLRAAIEAVPSVSLRDQDNPTRDPRVVSALWDAALVRRATPVAARPVQSAAADLPQPSGRSLLVLGATAPTPGLPDALPVVDRRSDAFTATVTGRLFFTMDGVPRSCTGQVINSATGGVVATAGHCLFSTGDDGARRWAQNLMFVPGFRDGVGPLGRWFAANAIVAEGWERDQDWSQDVGFVRLQDRAGGLRLQQLSGALGAIFSPTEPATATVFGYPAAGPFDGSRLRSCQAPTGGAPDPADPGAFALPCNMTAGYSGGPWVAAQRPDVLLAVSSHDYGTGQVYGTRLGPGALEAYRRADTTA